MSEKGERAVLDLLPAWAAWAIAGTLVAVVVGAALFDRRNKGDEG